MRPKPQRAGGAIGFVETMALCVLLLGIIGLAAAQIVLRNFFSTTLFWADEVVRLAVLWLAIIGAMVASREGRHLAIGIVPRYFPAAWQRPAAVIASGFAAAVSAALAWQSFRFVADARSFGDTLLGDLPAWWFQSIMPFGFAVMALRFALHAVRSLRVSA